MKGLAVLAALLGLLVGVQKAHGQPVSTPPCYFSKWDRKWHCDPPKTLYAQLPCRNWDHMTGVCRYQYRRPHRAQFYSEIDHDWHHYERVPFFDRCAVWERFGIYDCPY